MRTKSTRERLLASSMICGAALAALSATPALAQEGEVAEVVVTGTRIPSPNLESVSPVTAIGAAEIKAQGVTRVEDMVNSLPQAFAAQGSALSNGSTGTATVNLRGLGSTRTLVLIDGRRLMPGTPNTTGASLSPDLNFIPAALVQRVDVLTGGASAVYGADAVAGVVNFIMNRNFEGVRIDAQYSIYQHNNDNEFLQDIIRDKAASSATPEDYRVPDKEIWLGESSEVTVVLGVNSPDGRGNVTTYAGYRHVEPILQANYDYSACAFFSGNPDFSEFGCGGSGTAYPARFQAPGRPDMIVDVTSPNTQRFRPRVGARDVYNYGPTNYYQRPDDRYVLGAFGEYEMAPYAKAYMDVMFMDDTSTAQIAPGGVFAGEGLYNINCNNALATFEQLQALCGAAAGTDTYVRNVTVARRNVEGGGRQQTTEHRQYRYVLGLRGDIGENWNYDAYMQYGRVSYFEEQTGYFRTPNIQNALDVVTDPATGQAVCRSVLTGTDPNCVPYNIWKIGGVTPEALEYLEAPSYKFGNLFERVVNATIGGDLTPYGIKSPWAEDGVGVSFGAEYRREQLDFGSDAISASGELNGAGTAFPPVDGSYDVYELFGEARIPLVSDAPFAKSLTLETAYRFSDYSSVGTTHTYKLAGDWEPVEDLRVRASYQRAVRAPHIIELFGPQNITLDGTQDPCAGLAAGDPLVQRCAQAFGLTTAQVLAIEENPAAQYNGQIGGNPDLDPETSDTYSIGFVAQPSFLPGFNLSVDWFDIKVEDYISQLGANLIVNECVNTLDPYYCGLVHRDEFGSLWLTREGYVIDTTLNTGSLRTKGVDFNASYRTDLSQFGMDNAGGLSMSFVGTWLDSLAVKPLPDSEAYDCAGLYGTTCSVTGGMTSPNPEWRHKLRVTWNTPFEFGSWVTGLGLSVQWRHFSKVTLDAYDDDPQLNNPGLQYESDRVLAAQNYIDLTATWTMRDNISFRAGVNNVFDNDPPLTGSTNCPAGPCSGNTWPQMYDSFGRYLFIGLTADF